MKTTKLYLALSMVLETPDKIEENKNYEFLPNVFVLYNQQIKQSVDIMNSN
jgi:hypothetical protein